MPLPFIRTDLNQLTAYTPHPGEPSALPVLDQLDTNECPYDLPLGLKEKLAWLGQQTIPANRYPDGGHMALKTAIAEYVSETAPLAAPFTAAAITVGNGSDELIRSLLIATCLGGQGSILVANPTFSMYAILAQTLGVPVVTINRNPDSFELDLTAAQQAIEQPQTPPVRVVFMVHPNSPTANPLTEAELAWLRQLPDEVLVVVDEAYFEFSQQTTVGDIPLRSNWVVLRTFSKAFRLAAYRVGYGIAQPELITALEKVRLPYNLPALTQAAAQIALAQRQELLAVIPEIQAQRDVLLQALQPMPNLQVWPSAANFIYLRPRCGEADRAAVLDHWFNSLKAQGTLIRATGGGLRITIGTPAENQRTIAHLQAIAPG